MSVHKHAVYAILALAVCLLGGQAIAAEFSADLVITQPDESITIKLFVRDSVYRVEQLEGENLFLAIENSSTNVTTAMNPEEKTYKELDGPAGAFSNPVKGWQYMTKSAEEKLVGTETINGFECDHYTYNYPGQTELVLERWHSKKLNHFVKYLVHYDGDMGDGTMEIQNVVEGPQDDALFTVPADYTREKTPDEIEMERPAITSLASSEAPIRRRMAAGGELRVKVVPGLSSRIKASNLIGDTSTFRVHLYAAGQKMDFSNVSPVPEENFSLTYKGERGEKMYGMQHEADEIRVLCDKGRIMMTVVDEYSSFDDMAREQYYFDASGGGGVSGRENRPLKVIVTGDSPTAEVSHVKIHVYAQEFVDGYEQKETIEEIEFDLKNKEVKTLEYPAGEKAIVLYIKIDEGGGIKVLKEVPRF